MPNILSFILLLLTPHLKSASREEAATTRWDQLRFLEIFTLYLHCWVRLCLTCFIRCRVVKERVERCPSRSSVCSVCWDWWSCSAKEKESEHCCGPSSSRCRSVRMISWEKSVFRGWTTSLLWLCFWLDSAQALPYVGLLIAMIFFIYAVIGMQVSFRGLNILIGLIMKLHEKSTYLSLTLLIYAYISYIVYIIYYYYHIYVIFKCPLTKIFVRENICQNTSLTCVLWCSSPQLADCLYFSFLFIET